METDKLGILELWNMPHVIVAIDGKHVAMECPKNTGSIYHNYKGFFSQVLLAVCDAKCKFTFIDVGQYGSKNDSAVLKNSELGKRFESHSLNIPSEETVDEQYFTDGESFVFPYYMVGNDIFQLKDYLMRPYPGTKSGKLPIDQAVFNYRLSSARLVIENCFGVLVSRWRVFRKPIRAETENVTGYILPGIVLHNYLQQTENTTYCPRGFVDSEANGEFLPGEWRSIVRDDAGCFMPFGRYQGSRYENNAIKMRDHLKDYVNSEEGSLSWQLN